MLYLHEPETMSLTEYKWSSLGDRKRAETLSGGLYIVFCIKSCEGFQRR